jgi:hypothetical protein
MEPRTMDALIPPASSHPGSDHQLLEQIADTLGVRADAFQGNTLRHLLHAAEDGTQWFLASGEGGVPVARQVGVKSGHAGASDESIARFIVRHVETPQGRALGALIDSFLAQLL